MHWYTSRELLLAMGFPVYPSSVQLYLPHLDKTELNNVTLCSYNKNRRELGFGGRKRSAMARQAGDPTTANSVGAVLLWLLAHVVPTDVEILAVERLPPQLAPRSAVMERMRRLHRLCRSHHNVKAIVDLGAAAAAIPLQSGPPEDGCEESEGQVAGGSLPESLPSPQPCTPSSGPSSLFGSPSASPVPSPSPWAGVGRTTSISGLFGHGRTDQDDASSTATDSPSSNASRSKISLVERLSRLERASKKPRTC